MASPATSPTAPIGLDHRVAHRESTQSPAGVTTGGESHAPHQPRRTHVGVAKQQLKAYVDLHAIGKMAGSTRWKLGAAAADLIGEARARGKTVHMGRVNSWQRWVLAAERGANSVDGTFLTYAPDANLARLHAWHDATHGHGKQPVIRRQAA